MTGTNTIRTPVTYCGNLDNLGYDVSWTGDAVGTISVMASITGDENSYRELTFSPQLEQPSGTPGGYLISLNQLPFAYVYLAYTNQSGDGVLSISVIGKDLN